jgi:hypothetical protein
MHEKLMKTIVIKEKWVDEAVWNIVCKVLLEPYMLLNSLERFFSDDANDGLIRQIAYLEQQIVTRRQEDDRIYRAYTAGVFDEYEFASQRKLLKETVSKLEEEIETLRSRVMTSEQVEEHKQFILRFSEQIQQVNLLEQVPFDKKQRIIRMVVDRRAIACAFLIKNQ